MTDFESDKWHKRARIIFWILGLSAGAILTYTTRYFLNADGINYIEMGESLRNGNWSGLVNTTESPGYAFLLGLGHMLLQTTVENELPLLKVVNFFCLAFAMVGCELFVSALKAHFERMGSERPSPLPFLAIRCLCYAMFLHLALGWVRIRLVAPDMMVFGLLLISMSIILRIMRDPDSYINFLALGISSGVSFLFKTFFFPFSLFVFILAGLVTGSLRKAVSRVLVAVAVMLVVASPLLIGLSREVGRFSYGEVGNYGYVYNLAGKGEPINKPEELNTLPKVELYRQGPGKTFPAGYDLAYWTRGMKPVFNAEIQWKVLVKSVGKVWSFAPELIILTLLWLVFQWRLGRLEFGKPWPLSLFIVLFFLAVPGLGIYCLMHVEPRYLVAFFFLPFVGIMCLPRYDLTDSRTLIKALASTGVLMVYLLAGVVETTAGQSMRGFHTTGNKISHYDAFRELVAVNEFLDKHGIKAGDEAAVVGTDELPPTYWARMSGIRITGSIPNEQEFVNSDPQARSHALKALRAHGIRAVVARGSYIAGLVREGWKLVPGTRDYYAIIP